MPICINTNHTIHRHHHHFGWDRTIEPVCALQPGESVSVEVVDASAGQITPETCVDSLTDYDTARVNPVTGPIFIEDAEPGDVLRVTIEALAPSGWGWTANFPGFGLLADQFPDPALHIWRYEADTLAPAMFGERARVPLKPFPGTIGVAPAEPGPHSAIPPRRVGGNMDIRDLGAGSVLYLPVEVPGALLSIGDTHAAQGDGEVCGTALESPMEVAVTVDLQKQSALAFPRFTTPGPVTRHLDADGYDVTTGIGPDLMQAARDSLSGMVELLSAREHMAPVDAYILCSVCGDLRVSEIVDQPNWVVSFYFPRAVFS